MTRQREGIRTGAVFPVFVACVGLFLGDPGSAAGSITVSGGGWNSDAFRGGLEAAAQSGDGLVLDLALVSPIQLTPEMAGQTLDLVLRNSGSALPIGGLDLKIAITWGSGPGPSLTGMDLRSGLVFTPANSAQGTDPANSGTLGFWNVSINDPFSPPSLEGGGAATKVGTLTLSTVGVAPGVWILSFFGPETALYDPFGDPLGLTLHNANLQVAVPEPKVGLPLSGIGLLGWACLRSRRRWRRRR